MAERQHRLLNVLGDRRSGVGHLVRSVNQCYGVGLLHASDVQPVLYRLLAAGEVQREMNVRAKRPIWEYFRTRVAPELAELDDELRRS